MNGPLPQQQQQQHALMMQQQQQHAQAQAQCGPGCAQPHAHSRPQVPMQQPMLQQQQSPPFFGPHPQQQQPQHPPFTSPPQQQMVPPPQAAVLAPRPALNPALCNFSVQQSHPLVASIVLHSESFEPLRAWMPFIQWDGSWLESYPLQTEFRLPAARLGEAVQQLMARGFAPTQGRLAARISPDARALLNDALHSPSPPHLHAASPGVHLSASPHCLSAVMVLTRGRVVLFLCLAVSLGGAAFITDQQRVEKARMHRAVEIDKLHLQRREAALREQRNASAGISSNAGSDATAQRR